MKRERIVKATHTHGRQFIAIQRRDPIFFWTWKTVWRWDFNDDESYAYGLEKAEENMLFYDTSKPIYEELYLKDFPKIKEQISKPTMEN